MKPKLTDVAKKAGVSVTTVSRVINNYGYLSEATKAKVFAAMKALNYQPNTLARSLHGKRTQLIGLIFPSISNPFFGELVETLERDLFNKNYKVILCNSADDKPKEKDYLRMLSANQVDGIISGAHNLGIKEYKEVGLPVVAFDRNLSETIPIVSSDNYLGATLATKELYQANCQNIYFLGHIKQVENPTDQRVVGYKEQMKKFNLQPNLWPLNPKDSVNLKIAAIKDLLLTKNIDGAVCSDDLTAILLARVASSLHISVPEKLKIVGYDGTKLIQNYYPKLTTIVQPIADISSLLIKLLMKRISDPAHDLKQMYYQLPVHLLRRQTSANF